MAIGRIDAQYGVLLAAVDAVFLQGVGEACGIVRAGHRDEAHRGAIAVLELGGGAFVEHLASGEHGDAVCELVSFFQVLGSKQDRGAVGRQPADGIPHGAARGGVEARGRLVEEQQRGRDSEGGGDI